ncbi:MAG: inosine/xanthosine triphosphatase [Candidatus Pacebacteria bacterium CG10_big_fil_rev_8_21_14_0_10_44_11]|nr:MAG: inosine/xanthosine triphosphatase [Candidatus Pacebacteria bacterium CG10_big_fil_rev_8_21_14_0_10_44_11]
MQIFVGSTNPVKINAVTQAVAETFPTAVITSLDVPSGIADQPRSDQETRRGAYNRAVAAMHDGFDQLKLKQPKTNKNAEVLAIGLEGGVFEMPDSELWSTVWACVVDAQGNTFESNGARFKVPDTIAKAIRAGGEMGPVVSKLMGGKDIRRGQGAIGVITNNFIDRTEEYSVIAKMALGLWYGQDWQKNASIS